MVRPLLSLPLLRPKELVEKPGPFLIANRLSKLTPRWIRISSTKHPTVPRQARFARLLGLVERLLAQQPKDKNKLYSLHAPEVVCITNG
jgi:hypothetical protein